VTLVGSGAVSLLAITSSGKIGLGLVALVFIAFALVSSFVLPRRNPDFPGGGLGAYMAVAALIFVAMVAAVVVFAKESEEAGDGAEVTETAPAETNGETAPTDTGSQPGETEPAETEPAETESGGSGGDAAAGEAVFVSAGCGGCHALEAAGSSGAVGPNLDQAKPSLALAIDRVTNGKGVMPAFADQLDETQIQNVAAYVVESTSG